MRISRYLEDVASVPVDFFADPDGEWEFEGLVEAAGFDPAAPGVAIGSLSEPYHGHPDGAAVVVQAGSGYLAIIECTAPSVVLQLPVRERGLPVVSGVRAA